MMLFFFFFCFFLQSWCEFYLDCFDKTYRTKEKRGTNPEYNFTAEIGMKKATDEVITYIILKSVLSFHVCRGYTQHTIYLLHVFLEYLPNSLIRHFVNSPVSKMLHLDHFPYFTR